jgi:hypothetical protein
MSISWLSGPRVRRGEGEVVSGVASVEEGRVIAIKNNNSIILLDYFQAPKKIAASGVWVKEENTV